MGKAHHPRRGSMQIWPRKRAKKQVARVRVFRAEKNKLCAFLGYKAGMISYTCKDTRKNSPTINETITYPATIIECPPVRIFSVRFYVQAYGGLQVSTEVQNSNLPKQMRKYLIKTTKQNPLPTSMEGIDHIRLILATQPYLTGIGKKRPDFFEVPLAGTLEEQLTFAKNHLDKDISISQVFQSGELADAHSVSKGKGYQGTVKRFGVMILSHKAEKTKRGIASLGPWTPHKVKYTVPQAGRMGYHQRTDYNKLLLAIHPKEKAPAILKAMEHYGVVKNDFIIVKGTVPGTEKRQITLTKPTRLNKKLVFSTQQILQ